MSKSVNVSKNEFPIPLDIEPLIHTIRDQKVILDSDLAAIYGVPTYRFNEAVNRTHNRFPSYFMFQLNSQELTTLTSQNAMSKTGRGGRRTLPYAFTEHGAVMAANILRSPRAVQMSVFVVRAFMKMRQMIVVQQDLARELAELENKLTKRLNVHESAIVKVIQELILILNPPPKQIPIKKKIGFQAKQTISK
ncbi:MAG: ORF6N domain-containing protein [Gemmatimonadota bacterium]|nr:MAG: ORF6N domain-containing protein [Gemmatimonadota bacterium]